MGDWLKDCQDAQLAGLNKSQPEMRKSYHDGVIGEATGKLGKVEVGRRFQTFMGTRSLTPTLPACLVKLLL